MTTKGDSRPQIWALTLPQRSTKHSGGECQELRSGEVSYSIHSSVTCWVLQSYWQGEKSAQPLKDDLSTSSSDHQMGEYKANWDNPCWWQLMHIYRPSFWAKFRRDGQPPDYQPSAIHPAQLHQLQHWQHLWTQITCSQADLEEFHGGNILVLINMLLSGSFRRQTIDNKW